MILTISLEVCIINWQLKYYKACEKSFESYFESIHYSLLI